MRPLGGVTWPKCPQRWGNQSQGFIEGIKAHVADFAQLATVVHGTTVGTNALLERKGAKTGIITTAGFRDTLEMRRRDRPQTWGLWGEYDPVVSRDCRVEVSERTLADGTIHAVVDPEEVRQAALTSAWSRRRGDLCCIYQCLLPMPPTNKAL